MKRKVVAVFAFAMVAGMGIGGYRWNEHRRVSAIVLTNVPILPSVFGSSPTFVERIQKADAQVRREPSNVEVLKNLGQLYHANGYLSEAWQCYRMLMAIDETNPLWTYRLAFILSGYGRLEESLAFYRKAIELDPNYMPARTRLGDALLKLEQFDEALAVYRATIEVDRYNPFSYFGQARVAIAQGNLNRSKVLLEVANQYSSSRLGGDLLADVYAQLGEIASAREILSATALSSHCDIEDPWIDGMVSDSYDSFEVAMAGGKASMAGNNRTAIALLKRASSLDPLDNTILNHLAKIQLLEGEVDEARQSYQRSVNLAPSYSDGWSGLIDIELKAGNAARASELIGEALIHCPQSAAINNFKGNDLLEIGRPVETIPFFQAAIRDLPHEAIRYTNLARAYFRSRQEAKGVEQMELALKCEPSNPAALVALAAYYIFAENEIESRSYLLRCAGSPRISEEEVRTLERKFRERFE